MFQASRPIQTHNDSFSGLSAGRSLAQWTVMFAVVTFLASCSSSELAKGAHLKTDVKPSPDSTLTVGPLPSTDNTPEPIPRSLDLDQLIVNVNSAAKDLYHNTADYVSWVISTVDQIRVEAKRLPVDERVALDRIFEDCDRENVAYNAALLEYFSSRGIAIYFDEDAPGADVLQKIKDYEYYDPDISLRGVKQLFDGYCPVEGGLVCVIDDSLAHGSGRHMLGLTVINNARLRIAALEHSDFAANTPNWPTVTTDQIKLTIANNEFTHRTVSTNFPEADLQTSEFLSDAASLSVSWQVELPRVLFNILATVHTTEGGEFAFEADNHYLYSNQLLFITLREKEEQGALLFTPYVEQAMEILKEAHQYIEANNVSGQELAEIDARVTKQLSEIVSNILAQLNEEDIELCVTRFLEEGRAVVASLVST